jgi:DNA-binding CsgD family transcriptional regulator/tetratricopeptide (TPR) repeat protein
MLLERDQQLTELKRYLDEARQGRGRLVFLSGEAGAGKTTLIEAFSAELGRQTPIAIVSCDGIGMPGPFGPLFDVAEALGPQVRKVLHEQAPQDAIYRAVLTAFRETPVPGVMVGEDAHWSDEATLNLVRFLGRRIGSTRMLMVITFREEDIEPYHPLRRVLGDLASEPAVARVRVPPLSVDAVRTLAEGTDLDPVTIHQRTGGNPFFVTELVSASESTLPPTIREAVLGRVARISPEARGLLDFAATIGPVIDPEILAGVTEAAIENGIDEAVACGVLRADGDLLQFRHALMRDVLLEALSPVRRRALHRVILEHLRKKPAGSVELATLAHHADESRNSGAVLEYAPAAAHQAAAYGAHREAAAQYERALRYAAELDTSARAELHACRAYECYLTGLHEDAIVEQRRAVELLASLNEPRAYGDALRWLSRFNWFTGRNAESERLADEAVRVLEALPPTPELAMAYSTRSQLEMLAKRCTTAIDWGNRAIALAEQFDDTPTLVHAMTNVGTARFSIGDLGGIEQVETAAALGRTAGLHDDVSRALTNLACECLDRCQPDSAARYLEEAIEYCADHDLIGMELYLRARRLQLRLDLGDWDGIEDDLSDIANQPGAVTPTLIVANTLLGLIRARQGADPWPALDIALDLAQKTRELQRLGPVRIARAEAAWIGRDSAAAIAEALAEFDHALDERQEWLAGSLGIWLHRSVHRIESVAGLAEPFALEIEGRAERAADYWRERGYPLEEARALVAIGDESSLLRAHQIFDRLGARPEFARTASLLRGIGAKQIPRGPRASTRGNAAQLTNREIEILRHVAAGRTNREIADTLFLSERTVGHHVSAILGKLQISSRAEAHARAAELQILLDR